MSNFKLSQLLRLFNHLKTKLPTKPIFKMSAKMLYLISLPQKYTSRIVLQNSELTAKYQHPLVQIGQKIPEGLVLQMGVPV